jgi:hypothetical protein
LSSLHSFRVIHCHQIKQIRFLLQHKKCEAYKEKWLPCMRGFARVIMLDG